MTLVQLQSLKLETLLIWLAIGIGSLVLKQLGKKKQQPESQEAAPPASPSLFDEIRKAFEEAQNTPPIMKPSKEDTQTAEASVVIPKENNGFHSFEEHDDFDKVEEQSMPPVTSSEEVIRKNDLTASSPSTIKSQLKNKRSLTQAFLLKEVLDKPISMRKFKQ